jgi:sulfhydrogenase subunit beta (sulfur reductase)
MTGNLIPRASSTILSRDSLNGLIPLLTEQGYTVIGPKHNDNVIVYDTLVPGDELPVGWSDQQDGGRYRLVKSDRNAFFDYVVGPHSWKRYLFPPAQRLWQAQRRGRSFRLDEEANTPPHYAFLGVRSCEIHAMQIQDRVFNNGDFADPAYLARRSAALIVAVNCARPSGTCFCNSMATGPRAERGFDLALTELLDENRHVFLVEVGSERGASVLAKLPHGPAQADDLAAARAIFAEAARTMGRRMISSVDALLKTNLEHPRWQAIAQRCLSCANCTLVCPTCFCTTVEDVTDLSAENAERWRRWDSCFNLDFSYIHGGSIRREVYSRYRQWMTHKLSTWHEQFGSSGCVGCGRCITWCPVGIDITEEARLIRDSGGGTSHGRD